ncbi:MAG: hypothetical protein HYT31_03460 [Parcubacteria group bacterium]|nr:hypothetical protein [Parcubacteria group bacterium]
MDTIECRSRPQCGCTGPECLDDQIKRVQTLRAEMADKDMWQSHLLVIILYFEEDRSIFEEDRSILFTFTSLTTFTPTIRGAVWIVGTAKEHPPNTKQGYYGITKIISEIVPRETRQIYDN